MKYTYLVSALLVSVGLIGLVSSVPVEGDEVSNLRMHQIYETTTWDLLEDMYLYHNAIRYYYDTKGLKFNRTVSFHAKFETF